MFNIGGGELIVIMVLALIVLGPKRLPDAARQIGKTMGDLRRLSTGFQNEVRSALDEADDPNRVAARRNVLAKEQPVSGAGDSHPVRTEPLVAGPGLEPRVNEAAPVSPARVRPRSAQERAAAKKGTTAKKPAATKASPAPKRSAATNGTPVKKAPKAKATTKKAGATKPAAKAAKRTTKT